MLHKEFWGILFLAFVAWVFLAGNPNSRIENFCRPVGWTGNVVTSLTALVLPDQQTKVQGWFDKLEYGCRYMTWRLFYQETYNKWLEETSAAEKSDRIEAPLKRDSPPRETEEVSPEPPVTLGERAE